MPFSKRAPQPVQESFAQVDVSSLERRLRTLEESVTNLRKIVQVTEENILVKNRHITTEFKALTSDINEIRRETQDMRDKMLLILREMQGLARAEDMKVIERYVGLWNPVKFVTHGEIEEIVSDIVLRKQKIAPGKDEE